MNIDTLEFWYVNGSQHLYGEETLNQVATNSQHIVIALNDASTLPINVMFKRVLKTPDEIRQR
jgi:L-arabinose isomerase